jgi:transcriptional regulator with XRE-family HTH domain
MDTVNKRIKALRICRALSSAELARRVGIKPPSMWALENKDGVEPSGRVLALLCRELHSTPDFVMFGSDDPDQMEIEMQAAEIVYAMRKTTHEGRIALVMAARGLVSQEPSIINPRPGSSRPPAPAPREGAEIKPKATAKTD